MRRISWIDQGMRSDVLALRSGLGFFGRRLVGLMLDGSHHCEGEHDERDVTMPAVPGSGFVVVEPELVFGCLEAILDRPTMALDADQGLDRSPCGRAHGFAAAEAPYRIRSYAESDSFIAARRRASARSMR